MKFATIIEDGDTVGTVGIQQNQLVRLSDLGPWASIRELIEGGDAAIENVKKALSRKKLRTISAAQAKWAPPIPDPSKMLFIALNNVVLDEILVHRPDFPVYFPKINSALAGSGAILELHAQYGLTHAEPELGVIIGKRGRYIAIENAMNHVFGYTVINDVTSATMRMEDVYLVRYPMPKADFAYVPVEEHLLYPGRYKNADGFAPMGPYIVSKDEIDDPHNLYVKAWIDEDIIADDNTKNLHYSVSEVIHWISMHSTLEAGDIISMGTALHPDAQCDPLSRGDLNSRGEVVRVEIESIGTVETPIKRIRNADPKEYFAANKRFVKTLKTY
ncbi:fumarylacetoacetate hydrolase family protein [uncultured Parasphingorhabdus sp.]|uniref:fumarylacetoacetate hydrolase family protein n=1 Tax=uncultured Parasphingorhabdus sp. TaxID=2709694 RepID=UPI0030DA3609|tara:strand:- start:10472 stop:11464 length:993 start_codon:yes stop_codon:yes gene_type:complete